MQLLSALITSQLFLKKALLHLSCWLVFIAFELLYLLFYQGYLEAWYTYAIFYTLNISLFYCLLGLMAIRFRPKRLRPLLRLLSILPLLLGYASLRLIANHYLTIPRETFTAQLARWHFFLLNTILRGGYFICLAGFYWMANHLADYARRLANARNAHLQQQLHPHLLFNSLNFIYNQVYQHSAIAAQQVYLLSELMRFSLSPTGQDGKIALSQELEQVGNLIEINRHRFQEGFALNIKLPENGADYRLIPLVLLTLTENMFKHGNLTNFAEPAILDIFINPDRELRYYSRNLKKYPGRPAVDESIGLRNIRLRLDLAYQGRYRLKIRDHFEHFELTLTIPV